MGYLDNIIIYSRSEQEHLEHLEEIFCRAIRMNTVFG